MRKYEDLYVLLHLKNSTLHTFLILSLHLRKKVNCIVVVQTFSLVANSFHNLASSLTYIPYTMLKYNSHSTPLLFKIIVEAMTM